MLQRMGPRGASSVLGKGFLDRYTISNIAKMDQEGAKGGQVGHKRVQEGPKECKRYPRWVTMLPRQLHSSKAPKGSRRRQLHSLKVPDHPASWFDLPLDDEED